MKKDYIKIATLEDIQKLSKEERAELKKRLLEVELRSDEYTFQPYKVVDKIRYDFEPLNKL